MKQYWELARIKIDAMSLRERLLVFAVVAFVMLVLLNAALLEPLLAKRKILTDEMVQQQGRMKEQQATLEALVQAKRDVMQSPLRIRAMQLQQELDEQEEYLKGRSDRLIAPDKMVALLRNVLSKNQQLQLVELKTLSAVPLLNNSASATANNAVADKPVDVQKTTRKKIYKHSVQITVRGGYMDLMRYLTALESMPGQMFWGEINFSVDKYPNGLLTITMFTLSLDKTWLTV